VKPIIDHVRNFNAADVAVMTVSLDMARFIGEEIESSGELARTVSKIINSHLRRRVVSLPASDGYVFVVDNSPNTGERPANAGLLAEAASEVSAKLRQLAPVGSNPKFEVRFVCNLRTPAITHEEFIAHKLEQRYQHTLALLEEIKSPSVIFLRGVSRDSSTATPIYALDETRTAFGTAVHSGHRDRRFETDPANLAADIRLMRKVCEQMSRMFDAGEVVPQYCPLNFNTLKDSRYWPIYEIELRNIASFFTPFVRWEVVNVPSGTPSSTISNVAERLRALSDNVSVCQSGRSALESDGIFMCPSSASEMSFFIPAFEREHEWRTIVDGVLAFATRHASSRRPIGLRNVPAAAQLPVKLFEGGVFLNQDESRRLNLVVSELVEFS
jgi:hypothetical protein